MSFYYQHLYRCSGYIDIDKIDPDAWPALAADLSAGEHGIIPLAFGNLYVTNVFHIHVSQERIN